MFYSHTFLSRKGPLGTVWLAAHLQHRLKKSHYTSTNVPSTAEIIMNPEAPIALRMSGFLLLGIVRIYSKQVEYLYHDSNTALAELNRSRPPVKPDELEGPDSPDDRNSIVVPKKPCLDEVIIEPFPPRAEGDRNVRNNDEITIRDPPHAVNNVPWVFNDSSVPEDASETPHMPMDQDHETVGERSHIPERERMRNRDHDTRNDLPTSIIGDLTMEDRIEPDGHLEESFRRDASRSPPFGLSLHDMHEMPSGGSGQPMPMDQNHVPEGNPENCDTGLDVPDIEILRERIEPDGLGTLQMFDFMGDRIEPDGLLEKQNKRHASKSPTNNIPNELPDMPIGGLGDDIEQSSSDGRGTTPDSLIQSSLHIAKSAEFALRVSPVGPGSAPPTPQVVQQQRVGQRKRKNCLYDRATVLTNKEMKENREDTSNLLRKKRLCCTDNLGVWKQQNRLKKDVVLFEPVITGLSADLETVFDPTKIHSKPQLISSRKNQDNVEGSPVQAANDDMETEHPNNDNPNNDPMFEFQMPLPPSPQENNCNSNMTTLASGSSTTSSRRDFNTIHTPSTIDTNFTSNSDRFETRTNLTETDTTPELTGSTADPENSTCLQEGRFGQYSPLSDIPESDDSPRHLDFLENNDISPTGTPPSVSVAGKEVLQLDALPETTRAAAQFLKRQSTGKTPNSSEFPSETIELGSILEKKTKRTCARMFFETLVLKSYDFIDVKQEEAFGEIKLKVTSKLKEQCSD